MPQAVDLKPKEPKIDNQCGLSQIDAIRANDIWRGRLILIMPEIMVAIGTGAITLGFCSFFFGLYGNRLINMIGFFGVGFGFALILQVVRRVILTGQPEVPAVQQAQNDDHTQV